MVTNYVLAKIHRMATREVAEPGTELESAQYVITRFAIRVEAA